MKVFFVRGGGAESHLMGSRQAGERGSQADIQP